MSAQIILASSSPRRRELLDQIGIRYRVVPVDTDETRQPDEEPLDYVHRMAREKSARGQQLAASDLPVLAADTIVVMDKRVLGKPVNREHAAQMLSWLSDREHWVFSAVSLRGTRDTLTVSRTRVRFAELSAGLIESYCASGEADDKAGAYAIQGRGAAFVTHISGSFSGVVGLPLFETVELLRAEGVESAVAAC